MPSDPNFAIDEDPFGEDEEDGEYEECPEDEVKKEFNDELDHEDATSSKSLEM